MSDKSTTWPSSADSVLHVHGQGAWHDDVRIVGTADGIDSLRNACTLALSRRGNLRHGVQFHPFTRDGEGFACHVEVTDEPAALPLPYHEEYAHRFPPSAIAPDAKLTADEVLAKIREICADTHLLGLLQRTRSVSTDEPELYALETFRDEITGALAHLKRDA